MAKVLDKTEADTRPQHLPIVNLASHDEATVAQQLLNAATEWGFIYVRSSNLAIDATHVNNIFNIVSHAV